MTDAGPFNRYGRGVFGESGAAVQAASGRLRSEDSASRLNGAAVCLAES